MADLAILVPSRGRPANVARLAEACARTCRTDYQLHFGFDDDDPAIDENIAAAGAARIETGPRQGLAAWTNELAAANPGVPFLASLGDDMVPVTDGWDLHLTGELRRRGPGFAYPNDLRRDDIPEAVVVSAEIVQALGWFCLPALGHWYVDNVWADLGNGAGCLTYRPDVIVRHDHPAVTGRPGDATYSDAAGGFDRDLAAYQKWRMHRMAADVGTVRQVRAAARF